MASKITFRLPSADSELVGLLVFLFFFSCSFTALILDKSSLLAGILQDFVSETWSLSGLRGLVTSFAICFVFLSLCTLGIVTPYPIPNPSAILFWAVFFPVIPLYCLWLCLKCIRLTLLLELCLIAVSLFLTNKDILTCLVLVYGWFSSFLCSDDDNTSVRSNFFRVVIACILLAVVSFCK